jgi:Ni/Co efflux regulator RcnB
MIRKQSRAAAGGWHAGNPIPTLMTAALVCAVCRPAWSNCPPGQPNCPSQERQHEIPRQQQPRVQQEPPRQPQLQQQRPPQFEQQREPPGHGVPAQLYRPAAPGVSPPWTAREPLRPGDPTAARRPYSGAAGPSHSGDPSARDFRGETHIHGDHAFAPFRGDRYRGPGGERYQRYGIGERLPRSLIIAPFVIANWTQYGLVQPPDGFEWVRYGPDVLLVDPATGQIADAAYSAIPENDAAEDPGNPPPAGVPYQSQAGFAAQLAVSGPPQLLGNYANWTAAVYQEAGQPVCYASTRAQTSAPQMAGPGALVLTVTQRPSGRDAVSVGGILTDASSQGVTMRIDQAVLDFYTAGANAFARDSAAAVPAFQNGSQAIIQSLAPNGPPVTYIFSLMGFSAAYAAITAACPVQ